MGMEWLVIAFVVSLWFSAARGVQRGAESAGHMYRQAKARLVGDAVNAGHGRAGRRAGRFSGRAAAATVTGTRVHLGAFWRGLREGWGEGRRRTEARRNGTTDYVQGGWDGGTVRPGDVIDSDPTAPDADEPLTEPKVDTSGAGGVETDTGRRAMALNRCPWNYGPRVCGKRQAEGSDYCLEHKNELAAHQPPPAPPKDPGCVWTLGDPSDPSASCGAPTKPGSPYCPHHDAPANQRTCPVLGRWHPPDEHPSGWGGQRTPCGRPIADPNQPDCGRHGTQQTEGEPLMTTPTTPGPTVVPGPEVTNVRQLVEFLKGVEEAAHAELDEASAAAARAATDVADASATLQRAKQESARMEGAKAHLAVMKLDPQSLGELEIAHADCSSEIGNAASRMAAAEQAKAAADDRVKNAEMRAAHANTAHTNIWVRHGGSQQAAENTTVRVADGGAYNAA